VPEHIYISNEHGELETLEETRFSSEDELQALIAAHPELLDGEQISPGNARRWILVSREKGVPESSGAAARWAVDHVIIDQDAVPTLAEVKRGSNPEIRRTIIGQVLEYAAHASETWTARELRSAFERQATGQGRDPLEELEALLEPDGKLDVNRFWDEVATNLSAKRLRLLFVADHIPDPLARVVGFLNAQMSGIEVLAVEIKRFHGTSGQTLVPRVIGRISGSRSRAGTVERLTRESFLEGFRDERVRAVADRLLSEAERYDADIYYGVSFGISIRARCPGWRGPVTVAWLYSRPGKGWMRTRDFSFGAAVFEEELPNNLRDVLQSWAAPFSADKFTDNVSSKGVKAWSVGPEVAVQRQDLLVQRLGAVCSELASL